MQLIESQIDSPIQTINILHPIYHGMLQTSCGMSQTLSDMSQMSHDMDLEKIKKNKNVFVNWLFLKPLLKFTAIKNG